MFSASTRKKVQWAARIFEQWKCIHNFKLKQTDHLDDVIDSNLLNLKVDQLSDILSLFLIEIWKQNGNEYPQETLYEIVLSIQYYMCMNSRDIKLLDYPGLVKMRNTLDNWMKQLSKKGVVCEHAQAKPITVDQENFMWNTGLLGDDTLEKLVNTLLYLISVHFTLQACDKHKSLKVGA